VVQKLAAGHSVDERTDSATILMKHIKPLLSKTEAGKKKVRLLSISISNFNDQKNTFGKYRQLPCLLYFQVSKKGHNRGIKKKNRHCP